MDSKNKWNRKHSSRLEQYKETGPNTRLKNLTAYLDGGVAVDFASGLGENSLFLAKLNYDVRAFDISEIAVAHLNEQASQQQLTLQARTCDLTQSSNLDLPENSIDLVIITYFLNREIFPLAKSIIKENGYIFMETFYLSHVNHQENVSNQYKLRPQELLAVFDGWEILYYEENQQEGRQTLFARKIAL
ncbi:methyltransferase domain-containing protein [Salipaludibacillus sp. HK11]|uniref:methyltransferase domain-containing protein n=1 Tax=Salipaludibacillus sp. HK11 TaxID=3394320 RepID=UPI0039FDC611